MHPLNVGVNQLDHSDVLWIHLLEHVPHALRVFLGYREDDGFAGNLAGAVFEAPVHYFGPLLAEGVLVGDEHLDVGALVVYQVRVDALLDERVPVFLGEFGAFDA